MSGTMAIPATATATVTEASGNKRPHGTDWEATRKRLAGKDMNDALAAGKELKEGIEVVHTKEFPTMLTTLLPAFTSILVATTRPNPDTSSTEHSLRHVVLEVLSRMPKNDILRPHAPTLLETTMSALSKDYEENALLASKIIFDLHKSYRPMPQDQVQPYLDFVQAVYRTLPTSVQRNFHMAAAQQEAPSSASKSSSSDGPFSPQDSKATPLKTSATPEGGNESSQAKSPSAGVPSTPTPKRPVKSTSSFRVLTECPLTVMLLFQLYPKFLKTNIPTLIQLMMEALAIRPPPLQSIVGSGKKIESHHKRLYYTKSRELVAAQVKTLSFLTYLLRGFADQMKPYEDRIATNVVSLMSSCPRESIGTRKELLVATRHILATDFRKGFFRHVDSLLDERILMGSHHRHSDQTIMRPLGYSTLADLVHHVRSMLTLKQLSRVVYMFSRVLHDSSMKLPMSIQITAVRLLLNVVDIIFHNKDSNPQIGRDLLDRILDTLVNKLGTLRGCVDTVRDAAANEVGGETSSDANVVTANEGPTDLGMSGETKEEVVADSTTQSEKPEKEGGTPEKSTGEKETTREKKEVICADTWMVEGAKDVDSLQEVQSMVRSIIVGLKTVVWCITNYRLPKEKDKSRDQASQASAEDAAPIIRLTKFERDIVEKYIDYAIPCMKLFVPVTPIAGGSFGGDAETAKSSLSTIGEQQQRDVLTYFAACFTVLDGFNLHRTLGRKIELLVDTAVDEASVMVIPRHLLGASRRTSYEFCEMLLGHLVQHLDRLCVPAAPGFVFFSKDPNGEDYEDTEKKRFDGKEEMLVIEKRSLEVIEHQEKTAATYLELFERVIKSLSAFPENERSIRPYLQKIIASSLRLSMEKGRDWPDNYCLLLRSLFRSISAGKFEDSYKEVLPMIPTILNGLYRIFQATEDESLQCIVIELCLTIPARLSSLLPHMPLLLRMIIPALKSSKEDLVNLGLRTLEFWIDNLNPEFLYPILAKQTRICTDLITSLTSHLRPVPYPYGLLALRLLGKLGGKNRRFLRDAINIPSARNKKALRVLSIDCEWSLADSKMLQDILLEVSTTDDVQQSGKFSVFLPLESAVNLLKTAAAIDLESFKAQEEGPEHDEFKPTFERVSREEFEIGWKESLSSIDVSSYCCDIVENTVSDQAKSALNIIYSSLIAILDLDSLPPDLTKIDESSSQPMETEDEEPKTPHSPSSLAVWQNTECLKDVVKGLLYGLSVHSIRQDASKCAKGLFLYCLGVLTSMPDSVMRIDANGSKLSDFGALTAVGSTDETVRASNEEPPEEANEDKGSNKLGSLRPFGYFGLTERFGNSNPFVICEALAEMISETSFTSQDKVVEFFEDVLRETLTLSEPEVPIINVDTANGAQLAFYESLLEALCRFAVSKPWNVVAGLRTAILTMLEVLGPAWAKQYEVELMHVAIASLKSAGQEIPFAGVKAFQFFVSISILIYGKPHDWDKSTFVPDVLAINASPIVKKGIPDAEPIPVVSKSSFPSDTVLNLLIIELASTKQLVRFAARYALKAHVFEGMTLKERESKLSSHMSTIKRVLFTRSLRLLPLPEQVAVIEALSTLVDFVPGLLPVADQHLLAFLSEYLKLSSIADGEMADSSIVGYVVDKNGFTGKPSPSKYSYGSKHMTGIFLRRECVARLRGDKYILIPEELPLGVQLRVSALRLLNTVIRRHADGFFDADSTTPIGNIRPHVISLLFRSLVSEPPMSVFAAHMALQDVLTLSVVTNDDTEGRSRSQSRLPKELLQTCIRPVLLNLRDYTRLSVPLLRGLARLLSLLSSWFNRTLGEKLLEHLQKWTEPELVVACAIWKVGDEPTVAARILDLFALLPHASHFVEPLVKTVIKLEAALHRFKGNQERSPYRKPLARYLNKQSQHTVNFFFQRLKNSMYNELFQDIVALKESETLRTYLSGRQCSVSLLNVCFERPLAIIRSEKTSASKTAGNTSGPSASAAEIMSMHGIAIDAGKQREVIMRQDIDSKQKKLLALQQEAARTKEVLQARLVPSAAKTDDLLEDAKRRHRSAQATYDKAQKELNESKQRYAAERAHPEAADSSSAKKMTVDALELQRQGFKLVETLVNYNENYLTDHNDIVRAFRWLWRSKGRHLRLQHEELMPPRFHKESKLLGLLLVKYAKAFPNDVDVLFELLRIFLQPTTCDFTFIRVFLADTVSLVLSIEKKRHVIQRFFALLAGEGPEETKVLSIQLIVLPMLINSLSAENENVEKDAIEPKAADDGDKEVSSDNAGEEVLVNAEMVQKFVKEVLMKNGIPALFGDRVRVELLRMSTLLIRCVPKLMDEYKKDVLKFSWGLLKSEDTSCKSWAYLNVCNFIAAFETPGRIILQVYVSMIRLHQHEGKGFVRSGLSILLPSLSGKLDEKEFTKLIEYSIRIIYEEGNNIPQLAHIWQTIVAHPSIFVSHRGQFLKHMVISLTRLGLPPNCPIENRTLSLTIADLILEWNDLPALAGPKSSQDAQNGSQQKKLKGVDGQPVSSESSADSSGERTPEYSGLNSSMVDTIANFVVRMKILLADTKAESSTKELEETTNALLISVLRRWQKCSLHAVYFEKVVSMCIDEVAANRNSRIDLTEKKTREKGKQRGSTKSGSKNSKSSSSKGSSSHSNAASRDDPKPVSSALLLACLQIFTALVTVAPSNSFLTDNAHVVKEILEPCFLRARRRDGKNVRTKLKEFLIPLLKSGLRQNPDLGVMLHVKVFLESFIITSLTSDNTSSTADSLSGQDANRREEKGGKEQQPFPFEDGRVGGSCLGFFSLDVIKEISSVSVSFVQSFDGSLVALLEKLVSSHVQEVNPQRQTGSASPAGRSSSLPYQQATPTIGILEEARIISRLKRDSSKNPSDKPKTVLKVSDIGTSLRSIVTCMELISLGDLPFYFNSNRQKFMNALGSILDSSDNIQLLLASVGIVGKWLVMKDGSGPLASKERTTFLRKISCLDSRLKSPVVAQLLSDLVGFVVLTIAGRRLQSTQKEKSHVSDNALRAEIDSERSQQSFDTTNTLLQRCLVTCTLNANPSIRQKALSLLALESISSSAAFETNNIGKNASLCVQFRPRCLFDMVWQLLNSDFEGLCKRMWTLVFVEVLLSGCLPESGAMGKTSTWIPRPRRPMWNGSEGNAAQKSVNAFFGTVAEFTSSSESQRTRCLADVLSLAHSDQSLIQQLFEALMVSAWESLSNDSVRSRLITPIEKLLSRPYHAPTLNHSTQVINSVQSVLRACKRLDPHPVLDPGLLVSLAGTYRAWHEVTSILEHEFKVLSSNKDTALSERVLSCIQYCMQQLGEQNLALSIVQSRCKQPETSFALSLDVHGMVKEAISGYAKLVDLAESSENSEAFKASDSEMDVWEDRWAELHKEMGQLGVVAEYASSKENYPLLLEAAWKRQDWDKVDALTSSAPIIASCERGDPLLKMSEILLAITRGKLSEVENLHAQTAQLCLQKWQMLPDVANGSQCHSELLHFFHRLVEFRESGQIMVETMNHSNRRTLPDLKNLLSAWRHRLPNEYDKVSDWDDIITWRLHMFSSITSNFQWSEAGALSTLHDRPWTTIRMAKTARKQGLREVSTLSLNKISDGAMDVSDAFSKLREQILTFYNPDSDLERTGGLNLLNTTNLSFFDASQKSELFRLKAQFLSSLGGRSKANQAYCHAVQVCPSYSRAWVSWGALCSSLGRLAEKQQIEQQPDSGEKENPNAKKVAQYLAQAMGCYLEAVNCDTDEWCRIHLPKCLWMLAKDGAAPGVLSQTLESRGAALSCWVWLPWCPQLLTSLYRNEGKAAKAILTTLAKTYPQALYFPLRAFYLERRDVERSKGTSAGPHQGSVLHSEELMSSLRRAHASLWSSLEAILEELIVKFRPSYEEELLATMTALLDRAENHVESSLHATKESSEDEEAVVASISKTLGRIATKFFRETPLETASSKRDERARKTEAFKEKYKALFEEDFLSLTAKVGEKESIHLNDFLMRLRKWKTMLDAQVSSTPRSLPLVESSQSLALFSTEAPDLWPMSCDPRAGSALFESERTKEDKPNPSSTSASAMAAKTAAITAAISVAQSAASEGHGGEYGGGSSSIEIPGQYVPNSISAVDLKPSPELHAKLVRFESRVKVVRRNDQLIRRIGMVGSDGRTYDFLLQFAIPYWTRTDERTVQLCYLVDKILRRDNTCSRNFLSIQPAPVIPIAQRLRMTYETEDRLSLDDVFRRRCEEAGCETNVIASYYQSRVKKVLESRPKDNLSEDESKKLMATTNMEVLREICEKKVDRTILLQHVHSNLVSSEGLFHFRRAFASQLAINSLMQHAFSVVLRTPSRVVVNESSGQVFSPEFRFSYNNQGFLENQKVPFRMTPNLREMVGPAMMEGRFVSSMAMTATAIKSKMEDIDAILRLLLRDDIVSWYTSKSMAKSDTKTQELEKQLADRVAKNVSLVQSKISDCAVKVPKSTETLPTNPVDQRVRDLLAEASSYEKLSTIESSFQPWL